MTQITFVNLFILKPFLNRRSQINSPSISVPVVEPEVKNRTISPPSYPRTTPENHWRLPLRYQPYQGEGKREIRVKKLVSVLNNTTIKILHVFFTLNTKVQGETNWLIGSDWVPKYKCHLINQSEMLLGRDFRGIISSRLSMNCLVIVFLIQFKSCLYLMDFTVFQWFCSYLSLVTLHIRVPVIMFDFVSLVIVGAVQLPIQKCV